MKDLSNIFKPFNFIEFKLRILQDNSKSDLFNQLKVSIKTLKFHYYFSLFTSLALIKVSVGTFCVKQKEIFKFTLLGDKSA